MGVAIPVAMAAYGVYKGVKNKQRAKRDKKESDRTQSDILGRLDPLTQGAQQRSDAAHTDLQNRYTNMLDNPGGNYQSRGLPGYTEFSQTGGWDDAARGDVEGNISEWANLVRGEGANKTFKEFSETGGYTDDDKANIRGRVAAQTPSLYAGLSQELKRKSAVNPYAFGLDSAGTKLARESARASSDAVREGEIGLSESVREGRLAGAQGYTNSVLQSLAAKNNARQGMQDSINQGRQFGISGLEDVSQNEYAASQRDTEMGLEGLAGLRREDLDVLMRGLGMSTNQRNTGLDRSLALNQRADAGSDQITSSVMNGVLNYYMSRRGGGNTGVAGGYGRSI